MNNCWFKKLQSAAETRPGWLVLSGNSESGTYPRIKMTSEQRARFEAHRAQHNARSKVAGPAETCMFCEKLIADPFDPAKAQLAGAVVIPFAANPVPMPLNATLPSSIAPGAWPRSTPQAKSPTFIRSYLT